jgi:hypothetical protein
MTFAAFALATFFTILLWLVSGRFRPRLAGRERVTMQWSLSGKPNWSAPPRVALSLTPAVGTLTLFFIAGLVSFAPPEDGQGAGLLALVLIGLLLVAIHAGHMWFATRARNR